VIFSARATGIVIPVSSGLWGRNPPKLDQLSLTPLSFLYILTLGM